MKILKKQNDYDAFNQRHRISQIDRIIWSSMIKNKRSFKSQKTQLSSKNRKEYRHIHEIMTINSMSEEQESFVSRSFLNICSKIRELNN
jgi:hypothetical protein